MNFIPMMNWNGFSNFLSRFLKLAGALIFFTFISCKAQSVKSSSHPHSTVNSQLKADSTKPQKKFPDPHKVLFKSLMIPGWGQVINKQIYKVPIIYALLSTPLNNIAAAPPRDSGCKRKPLPSRINHFFLDSESNSHY